MATNNKTNRRVLILKKFSLSLFGVCLAILTVVMTPWLQTEAKTTNIEMKVKDEKMKKIMGTKKVKNSFEKRLKASDLSGSIKLEVKFKKVKDEKIRKAIGKANLNIGNVKYKLDLSGAYLNKFYDPEAKENIFHLIANSTFTNKKGNEEPVALYLTWNEKGDKQQGALTIGEISDYAVVLFGQGEEIINKDKDIRDFDEVEFNENEFEGE